MADELILHITTREAWQAAQGAGIYRSDSLAGEGFMHCSMAAQLVETAGLFYRGQDGLVLLCIDPSLVEATIKYEAPASGAHREDAGLFPHIYGPLNLDAVVRVVDFPARADGGFDLPVALSPARSNPVMQVQHMTEETAQKLLRFVESSEPVKRLRASQIASGALGAVGFALFIVGVERAAEDIPVLSNAYGSISVGVLLLLITGLLWRKLAGGA